MFALLGITSCQDDEWSNGDPAYNHIYYIGFEDWGNFKNDVTYNVSQGEIIAIPMQFYCEFNRNYNVETYYYVDGTMTVGTDFEIVDENGTSLMPDNNGAYKLVWPNALKGVKNIYVKALNGSKGKFNISTFNPNSGVSLSNQDVNSTIQHSEAQYEVRVFTQNYKVIVNIK